MSIKLHGKPYIPGPVVPYEFAHQAQPFPIDAFPSNVYGAITDLCLVDQAPVEIAAMGVLAVISIVLQNRIDVVRPTQPASPVSLNLLNVSKSGDGKTVVKRNLLDIILEVEKETAQAYSNADKGKESDRSFLQFQKKNLENRIKKALKLGLSIEDLKIEWKNLHTEIESLNGEGSLRQQSICSDATFEGLRVILEGEGKATGVISFDAGGVLNGMLTTNSTQLNDLWDGSDLTVQLASRTVKIQNPRLSMFLATQPNELDVFLEKARGSRALANGFFARFLFAESTPTIVHLSNDPKPGVEIFKKRVKEIMAWPEIDKRLDIRMNERANIYWSSYFNTLRQIESQVPWLAEISGFARKLPEQAARIAALFQSFENQSSPERGVKVEISEHTIRKAVRLCDSFMHSYRARFSDDGEARKRKIQSIASIVLKKITDRYSEKILTGIRVIAPFVDKNYRIRNVESGGIFTWNLRDQVISYTKREIQARLYECDYVLLGEALDLLAARGEIYLASGIREGQIVLYSQRLYPGLQRPRSWTELLPVQIYSSTLLLRN